MIHLARPNLAKTSIWNTLQDIAGSSSSTLLDGTTSIVVGISARRTDGVKAARSLGFELMDSSLSPTKRRALRNDTQPCCRLFYIAVSTVYSTYTTQNCFCPLLSFRRPIHIHCDATQLPYTNAILSRRWLSSIETFVRVRLSAGFHLGSSRLVNCHGHFWFLARLHESFEVIARVRNSAFLKELITRFSSNNCLPWLTWLVKDILSRKRDTSSVRWPLQDDLDGNIEDL